jgi:TPR repeat protein
MRRAVDDMVEATAWRKWAAELEACNGSPCKRGTTIETLIAEERRLRGVADLAAQKTAFAARDESCSRGNLDDCCAAGTMLAEGTGAAADRLAAARIWQRACIAGQGAACFMLAIAHASGAGVERDPFRAQGLLERFHQNADVLCKRAALPGVDCAQQLRDARRAPPLDGPLTLGGSGGDACKTGDTLACLALRVAQANAPADAGDDVVVEGPLDAGSSEVRTADSATP